MSASAYVDNLSGPSNDEAESVTLVVRYDGKEARLEIPVGAPLFDREPGVEAYRREVIEVIAALQEVVNSPEGIQWPYHR